MKSFSIKKRALIVFTALLMLPFSSAYAEQTIETLENRVRAGELGLNLSFKNMEDMKLTRIYGRDNADYNYELYRFGTYIGTVTFIVEDDNLVPLAVSWGGDAHSFRESGHLLHFKYDVGSGMATTYESSYVLGSGISPMTGVGPNLIYVGLGLVFVVGFLTWLVLLVVKFRNKKRAL